MLSSKIKNANIALAIIFLLGCLDPERSDPRDLRQKSNEKERNHVRSMCLSRLFEMEWKKEGRRAPFRAVLLAVLLSTWHMNDLPSQSGPEVSEGSADSP